jgi:beta-fructofuranosidase
VVSVWQPDALHCVAYAICSPDATGLNPGPFRRLSYGPSYYAASVFTDRHGRPGIVAWLRGVADSGAGWAGATSLPALVSLRADRLVLTPPTATATWSPTIGDRLDQAAFSLTARDGMLLLAAGEDEVELPWDGEPVSFVVDGPVLELYGHHGIAAVPLASPAT